MPIRPSQAARYPADWPEISRAIRVDRAGGRCECIGQCGRDHPGRCAAVNRQPHPVTGSRVVLTVAHLDHTPEHCESDNLLAMCQSCHLAYDAPLHAANAAATRRAARVAGMEPLFALDPLPEPGPAALAAARRPRPPPPVAGHTQLSLLAPADRCEQGDRRWP